MASTFTHSRGGGLQHIDFTITGTTADAEVEVDLTNADDRGWHLPRTIRIVDFSIDIHAGTATSLTPILSSVSGSTKARDTIQPSAGAAVRPDLGEGVVTHLGTGTSLWLKCGPNASHASNDIRGRITFCAAKP